MSPVIAILLLVLSPSAAQDGSAIAAIGLEPVAISFPVDPVSNTPSNSTLGNTVPSNTVPSNNKPGNTVLGNSVPSNSVPSNYVPSNSVPGNNIPVAKNSGSVNDVAVNSAPANGVLSNGVVGVDNSNDSQSDSSSGNTAQQTSTNDIVITGAGIKEGERTGIPPPPRRENSCGFGASQRDDYQPKNESTFPLEMRRIFDSALRGTTAEIVLRELAKAKQQEFSAVNAGVPSNNGLTFPTFQSLNSNRGNLIDFNPFQGTRLNSNSNGGGFGSNPNAGGFGSGFGSPLQNPGFGFSRSPSPQQGFGINSNNNINNGGNNINNNNNSGGNGGSGGSNNGNPNGDAGSNNNQNSNTQNNNNNLGTADNILGDFRSQNIGIQTPGSLNSLNTKLDSIFPGGSAGASDPFQNQGSVFDSNFSPPQNAGRVSSPFGFYGIQGNNNGKFPSNSAAFDGPNPFELGNNFPISRSLRRKRQATPQPNQVQNQGPITDTCDAEPRMLQEYTNHGGRCYVVMPELQEIQFVQCSQTACAKCSYPNGPSRCLPAKRGAPVWSVCERGPAARKVSLDYIYLPVVCTCKVMDCS